ncbi:MAG: hypothetical protein UX91_C0006G0130 [Candidatus Amesbacteria bacterium GW2011_GWB1_47_19]|nr:MAG: hypothetical protein UW51_C0002G0131 [Candidatus Amesbacteria bacterium GW2011_GWA1_44_24]KKU31279.1 MAG: hypothetical protein UX46_C0006G0071 [Candidatus Amesbacteria bacterium GW2011_GWC1_46_24]KKU67068.1 MAG: hypothetical protein UX91_C0006G0130 [Candidatus Amesbacteria bacterium GW2011_GWB1_47_19]OGD04941.1 MAG: hypothetical protein A2379_04145 [Candidatus Amesbacteria bacterium RIFOXYB1_FULL_47_13]
MKNLYTLWMIPPPEIKKVLEDVIRELGDKYKGPYFEPHMSLIYGDHQMKLREKIASEVKLPANLSFKVKKLVVTPCTNDPKDWIHLAEINLAFGS